MVKVTEKDYYMDGYLKSNLDLAKKVIKQDWDMVFCVDGAEGSGKSVIAQQMAYYLDPTLDLKRIVFTPEEFKRAIVKAKPYEAIIYDEGYTGLSSRSTMSQVNKTLVSMLAEIRQKNLFVFIVMPTFFDLDKYVALWRSRALIHVYTNDFQRGFFQFFNMKNKKYLYMHGKKFYEYKGKPNFFGRFTNGYMVDPIKYKRKKRDSLTRRDQVREEEKDKKEISRKIFNRMMKLENEAPMKFKTELLNISESTFYAWRKEYEENRVPIDEN